MVSANAVVVEARIPPALAVGSVKSRESAFMRRQVLFATCRLPVYKIMKKIASRCNYFSEILSVVVL